LTRICELCCAAALLGFAVDAFATQQRTGRTGFATAIRRGQDVALLFAGELPSFGRGCNFRIGRRPRITCHPFRRAPDSLRRVTNHEDATLIHQCFRFRVKISHYSILPFVLYLHRSHVSHVILAQG
jgi:hypothetical protein